MVEDADGYHPEGEWYYSIGQGMGAAINMADEKNLFNPFQIVELHLILLNKLPLNEQNFQMIFCSIPIHFFLFQTWNVKAQKNF